MISQILVGFFPILLDQSRLLISLSRKKRALIFDLKKTWAEVVILVSFPLFLCLKRLIDDPYRRKIKQESGW